MVIEKIKNKFKKRNKEKMFIDYKTFIPERHWGELEQMKGHIMF